MTTTSSCTKLGIRKLTARIGTEVTGVSPDLDLDAETVIAVRAAAERRPDPAGGPPAAGL